MKKFIYLLGIVFLAGCASSGNMVQKPVDNDIAFEKKAEDEKEEYDIIITDPGYSSFLASHAKPISFYTNEYYRQWNNIYVSYWNEKVISTGSRDPFNFSINYDYNTDYGLEVNYKLYNYFKYMQHLFGINLPGKGAM